MQLIGQFDSPFVRRVGIAMELYGLAYDHRPWSTFGDWAQFATHNPLRRVPTLVLDNGEALIDSAAIIDHLDEAHGRGRALIAQDGDARRASLRRIATATGMSDKAVGYFYARLFADRLDPLFVTRSEEQLLAGLATLNAFCTEKTGRWWHGDGPGHDDIAVACSTRHLAEAYPDLFELVDYPALAAHCAAAEELEAFRKVCQPFIPPS